jgi:hypothetical protein
VFDSSLGLEIIVLPTAPRLFLGLIQLPLQWAPVLGVKRPERETDHSPSAEVRNAWNCTFTPQYDFTK